MRGRTRKMMFSRFSAFAIVAFVLNVGVGCGGGAKATMSVSEDRIVRERDLTTASEAVLVTVNEQRSRLHNRAAVGLWDRPHGLPVNEEAHSS